jgi:hypothetical protein
MGCLERYDSINLAMEPLRRSKIADREKAERDQHREARGDQGQACLDEIGDRRAVPAQQPGDHEEAQAAGQDRRKDEHGQAEMRDAAREVTSLRHDDGDCRHARGLDGHDSRPYRRSV